MDLRDVLIRERASIKAYAGNMCPESTEYATDAVVLIPLYACRSKAVRARLQDRRGTLRNVLPATVSELWDREAGATDLQALRLEDLERVDGFKVRMVSFVSPEDPDVRAGVDRAKLALVLDYTGADTAVWGGHPTRPLVLRRNGLPVALLCLRRLPEQARLAYRPPEPEPKEYYGKLDVDDVLRAVRDDDNIGFCEACGDECMGIEPDATGRRCEACGELAVKGAEQILLENAI